MIRAIAYRLQERAHAGLALATKRRLRALADEIEVNGGTALDPGSALAPRADQCRFGGRHTRIWPGTQKPPGRPVSQSLKPGLIGAPVPALTNTCAHQYLRSLVAGCARLYRPNLPRERCSALAARPPSQFWGSEAVIHSAR